jgi:hypothetical protein
MSFTTFFRSRKQRSRRRPPRSHLYVERLEDRAVPSANIDITNGDGVAIETNIDLNPVNPRNLVAVAIHGDPTSGPPADAAYYSRDGGQTWGASSPLPLLFQGTTYDVSSDPSVAFDSRGNVYVAYIPQNIDFRTSEVLADAILVAKSTDGGATFTQLTAPAVTPGDFLDHPKVAVDHSPTSPFRDTVYMTWISEPSKDLVFSRSTDGGLTWSAPLTLDNAGNKVQLNTQTVGPDGTVYVSYVQDDPAGHSTQFVASSTDGGVTFSSRVAVTTLHAMPFGNGEAFPSPAQPNRAFGTSVVLAQASLDTDRSAGPFRGRLYMAYIDRPDPDTRPFDEDVYLQFSDDQGARPGRCGSASTTTASATANSSLR